MLLIKLINIFLFAQFTIAEPQVGDTYTQYESNWKRWTTCKLKTKNSSSYWNADCQVYLGKSWKKDVNVLTKELKDERIYINDFNSTQSVDQYGFLQIGDNVAVTLHSHSKNSGSAKALVSKEVEKIYVFNSSDKEHFLLLTKDGYLLERFFEPSTTLGNYPIKGSEVISLAHQDPEKCYNYPVFAKTVIDSYFSPISSLLSEDEIYTYVKAGAFYANPTDVFSKEVPQIEESKLKRGDQYIVEVGMFDQQLQKTERVFTYQEIEGFFRNLDSPVWYDEDHLVSGTVLSRKYKYQKAYKRHTLGYDDELFQKIQKQTLQVNIRVGDRIVGNSIEQPPSTKGTKVIGFNDFYGGDYGAHTLVVDEDLNFYFAITCSGKSSDPKSCSQFSSKGLFIIKESRFRELEGDTESVNRC